MSVLIGSYDSISDPFPLEYKLDEVGANGVFTKVKFGFAIAIKFFAGQQFAT